MQRPVHQQVRVMRLQRLALLPRLALHHRRAQHQVGGHHRLPRVVEGEDVGRVILAAVLPVQRLAFLGADDAHGQLAGGGERHLDAAPHACGRQHLAVRGRTREGAELDRQVHRRLHFSDLRDAS
jgi:hypothetical protein